MPSWRVSPNGTSASVATAVSTEIIGASAIIHGTAVRGSECSFESSFTTSASGWRMP